MTETDEIVLTAETAELLVSSLSGVIRGAIGREVRIQTRARRGVRETFLCTENHTYEHDGSLSVDFHLSMGAIEKPWPPDVVHLRQPTPTSCGLACVAMVAGVPLAVVMREVPLVRTSLRRRGKDCVNVGELARLLRRFGLTLGPRRAGLPPIDGVSIVRLANGSRTNWHWSVATRGLLYDPDADGPGPLPSDVQGWYHVTRSGGDEGA